MRILFGAVADDVEVVFGDSVRAVTPQETRGSESNSSAASSREVDLVVGADGQHSGIRELAFGPERKFTHHLGAYLSIFTVDNLLRIV